MKGFDVLPPDSRALLRDLLKPPIGARLVAAVGTTFTLDLAAALAVPLSFAARDLGETPDLIGVMEAVRSCADRVDVFYQAGQAAVPQESDVLAFLEPVLHPVTAPRAGHLFHPKVWVLKFVDSDEQRTYRLVCSTRNLTNDRSWDAVISLDGEAGPRREPGNEPLSRFLRALPDLCAGAIEATRRERVESLADEIRRVVWEFPDDASSLHFHALGLGRVSATPDFSGYRRLVVSPFVDAEGLEIVAPQTRGGTVLVCRPEHLDRLDPVPVNTELRVFSVLAELEDERAAGDLGGLHAKMVLIERNRRAHLFLGSANATRAAFGGNVEFLIEVVRGASKYGVEAHLSADTGFGALLEEYTPQPPTPDAEEEKRFQLQNLLRSLAVMRWTLEVRVKAEAFDLVFRTDKTVPDTTARLTVEALTRRGDSVPLTSGEHAQGTFVAVALPDITAFLVLTAEEAGLREATVIPAALLSDPEGRLDAVLARQVNSPEKFMRFLLLLLGLNGESGVAAGGAGGSGSWRRSGNATVFELLARALADSPRSLEDLARIVDRLSRTDAGRAVMPTGFLDLWSCVVEARQLADGKS